MKPTPILKTILLFSVVFVLSASGLAFAILHKEDFDSQIRFSLQNHNGETVTHEDLRGQYLLVFFGFTSCSHTCPVQMAKLSSAMRLLDQNNTKKRITPLLISVDPGRDTVKRMNEYLQNFDSRFIGLTGTTDALMRANKSFDAFIIKSRPLPSKNYDVMHSSIIYVVDPFSRIVDYIPFETDSAMIASRVKELLL